MADLTVSNSVDTLMQATNQAGLRSAVGLSNIADHSGGVTVDGELMLGALEPLYEDSGSIRFGGATRSIFGGAFIITRDFTTDGNGHGIDENTTINPGGAGRAYAAFDARGQLTATQDMDHYIGYQFDPVKSGSGSLSYIAGVSAIVSVSAGTITDSRNIQIKNASISGSGAITNQFGLYVEGLTGATNNWAIYCVAPTKSYIGGDVAIAGSARTPAATLDVAGQLKVGAGATTQVLIGRSFSGGEGGCYLKADLGYVDLQGLNEGVAYLPLVLQRRGGNAMIGTTTDNGLKLQVAGAMSLAPGSSVTPSANGDLVFEATSNTTVTVKLKGSDGTVRSGTITLS